MNNFAQVGDLVEWCTCDRNGMRAYSGLVTGDCPRRNTHVRVKTANGTRYARRSHLTVIDGCDCGHCPNGETFYEND